MIEYGHGVGEVAGRSGGGGGGSGIGGGTTDLTLFANLDAWFRDAGGNLLDPSSASGALVADNIARGFHAFEDENHDGSDDHGGDNHGGSDDGGTDDHGSGGNGADDAAAGI